VRLRLEEAHVGVWPSSSREAPGPANDETGRDAPEGSR